MSFKSVCLHETCLQDRLDSFNVVQLRASSVLSTLNVSTWCFHVLRVPSIISRLSLVRESSELFIPRQPLRLLAHQSHPPLSRLLQSPTRQPLNSAASNRSLTSQAASPAPTPSSSRQPSSTNRKTTPNTIRYKTRPTRSAPSTVERTSHQCAIVCNQSTPNTVTHLPSVDWQSNYYRARKSLNKLKLVRFQNYEAASRTPAANPYIITQWIPAAADT